MQEILDLSAADQHRLLKRLTHHAKCKMRPLTWRGAYVARGGSAPGGYQPYDFALDAIAKALDGTRQWNRTAYPTLEGFLRSVIDSDINHLVESIDNAQGRSLSPISSSDDKVSAYQPPSTEQDPVRVVFDKEWQERFRAAAMKELDGDQFLVNLFDCLNNEITERAEIAVLLGITPDEVTNGKKRLARKLDKLDTRIKPTKSRIET